MKFAAMSAGVEHGNGENTNAVSAVRKNIDSL